MNSLRIGWAAIAGVSIVTLLIGFADAQLANTTVIVQTTPHRYPSKLDGWIPPGQRTMEMVALQPVPPAPVAISLPPIVIPAHGMGGNLDEHRQLFATYRAYGLSVELRGPCLFGLHNPHVLCRQGQALHRRGRLSGVPRRALAANRRASG